MRDFYHYFCTILACWSTGIVSRTNLLGACLLVQYEVLHACVLTLAQAGPHPAQRRIPHILHRAN